MTETLMLLIAWAAGALIGTIFFGGLWWTVRKAVSFRQPALWFLASQLLRTAFALSAFYFVARGDWLRLLSCLFGFIVARMIVTWLMRSAQEVVHAPYAR